MKSVDAVIINGREIVDENSQVSRIIIEFKGPGMSEPNIRPEGQVTPGQVRDAALLLYAMAMNQVFTKMTQDAIARAQAQTTLQQIIETTRQ